MEKMKLILYTLISIVLFNTTVNADEWNQIGDGSGYAGDKDGSCLETSGCYCRWNDSHYGALKISIIYYDGFNKSRLGIPVVYFNSEEGDYSWWIKPRLPEEVRNIAHYKRWLPYTHAKAEKDEVLNISADLKESLIGNSQKNSKYPHIKEIFKDTKVSYDGLLAAVSSNGTYKDTVNGKEYHNMINEKMGSKGQATKGIRIIAEPLITIRSAGVCFSHSKVEDKMFTIKNLFSTYYGDEDNSKFGLKETVPTYTLKTHSKILYLNKSDAGYSKATFSGNYLANVSSDKSGYGLNIYGPFDEMVTNLCDPDQEYEGYKSGVQYCCKKYKITPDDKSKNTKTNLRRVLTNAEINADCVKQKCDPKIDGVDKCCTDCNVTLDNLSNNKESACMTGPIDLEDLENSSCNKGSGKNCDYALKSEMPNNCDSGNVGHVEDIASWSCVFNSTNKDTVRDHYVDVIDNDYCAVYCKEDIDVILPEPGTVGKAGRFLILGDVNGKVPAIVDRIKPIRYSASKTCRVTAAKNSNVGTINKSKFEHDMEKVEDEISASWDAWKIAQAQQKACIYGAGNYNGVNYTCPMNTDGTKKNISAKVAAAEKRYQNAIKLRNDYINDINACSEYATNRVLKFSPTVKFEYNEPTYGYLSNGNNKTWTLNQISTSTTSDYKFTKYGNSNLDMGASTNKPDKITKTMYECSGSVPCKKISIYDYPDVLWWESTNTKEINYGLPDNTYSYISKSTARSFDSDTEAGSKNYVDMKIPNLPIHISTNPGYYDYKITTTSFGSGNKFNSYIIDNKQFNKVNYKNLNDYSCKFKIDCEDPLIIPDIEEYCEDCGDSDTCKDVPKNPDCDPDDPDCGKGGDNPLGIELIYRPISLNSAIEAFPGPKGEGRKPGKNWTKESVEDVIVKNRGFEGYEVYKSSPLYEIELTPALMKEIRAYNKEQNGKIITIYDETTSSTGIAGYGDYDSMKCLGNGTHCISTKVRDWGVTGCGVGGFDKGKFNKCMPVGVPINQNILNSQPWD